MTSEKCYLLLKKNLETLNPDITADLSDLKKTFTYRYLGKGEFFTRQGDRDLNLAFIGQGLLRYFYTTYDGNDYTKDFALANDFASSYAAMLNSRPTQYSIVAEEESHILVIDRQHYMERILSDVKWERIARLYTERTYDRKERREADFLLLNATERYQQFMAQFPTLTGSVKQKHIATYLGINPVSLSRIKNQLNE